ncbi:hypothetical protein BX600DRAFT_441269 [Xylariales sp. PMI_506]|nr:hypothetical protein BX600DRAFT_441269 [Xylariales sp. PMI_506]
MSTRYKCEPNNFQGWVYQPAVMGDDDERRMRMVALDIASRRGGWFCAAHGTKAGSRVEKPRYKSGGSISGTEDGYRTHAASLTSSACNQTGKENGGSRRSGRGTGVLNLFVSWETTDVRDVITAAKLRSLFIENGSRIWDEVHLPIHGESTHN